jgi:REP element-mobilizing transposase RayT
VIVANIKLVGSAVLARALGESSKSLSPVPDPWTATKLVAPLRAPPTGPWKTLRVFHTADRPSSSGDFFFIILTPVLQSGSQASPGDRRTHIRTISVDNLMRPLSDRCATKAHIMTTRTRRQQRKRHVQLTLDSARKPMGHGGWRPGAGRPRTRKGVSHERREEIASRIPQHVTLRIAAEVPSLRRRVLAQIIKQCIARAHKSDFRIVHFNIESNHLHFIIEADGNKARSRGIAGLKVSIARRVNRYLGRRGALFGDRYHARGLRTPREVRNAIRYVLSNAIHHGAAPSNRGSSWIDSYSSAAWFDGWRDPIELDSGWKYELFTEPSPVAAPTVWLLAVGWRKHGALAFDEVAARA